MSDAQEAREAAYAEAIGGEQFTNRIVPAVVAVADAEQSKLLAEVERLRRFTLDVANGDGFTTQLGGALIVKCDDRGQTDLHRRAESAEAEVERLRIRNKSLWADLGQANRWSWEQHDRAESAERARGAALAEVTELRDRLGRVEALADEWQADYPGPGASWHGTPDEWWRALRAALAVPVTGDTDDIEAHP